MHFSWDTNKQISLCDPDQGIRWFVGIPFQWTQMLWASAYIVASIDGSRDEHIVNARAQQRARYTHREWNAFEAGGRSSPGYIRMILLPACVMYACALRTVIRACMHGSSRSAGSRCPFKSVHMRECTLRVRVWVALWESPCSFLIPSVPIIRRTRPRIYAQMSFLSRNYIGQWEGAKK